jgi:hypothetical protein
MDSSIPPKDESWFLRLCHHKVIALYFTQYASNMSQPTAFDVLWNHDIFGITESWAGQEVYEINGFISFSKGRTKVTKFGTNPGGLLVYIREGISKRVTEIPTNMKEILWVGMRRVNPR